MVLKFSGQSVLIVDAIAAEHCPTFISAFSVFELGMLYDAKVEKSTDVRVDARSLQLLPCLSLGVPVRPHYRLVPSTPARVSLPQLLPFFVDCCEGRGVARPKLSW